MLDEHPNHRAILEKTCPKNISRDLSYTKCILKNNPWLFQGFFFSLNKILVSVPVLYGCFFAVCTYSSRHNGDPSAEQCPSARDKVDMCDVQARWGGLSSYKAGLYALWLK